MWLLKLYEGRVRYLQIQKYERGANRVGASRLFELSKALEVPVGYFFDHMPGHVSQETDGYGVPGMTDDDNAPAFREGSVLSRSETLRLVTNYYRISSEARRRAIYEMIKGMAEAEQATEA